MATLALVLSAVLSLHYLQGGSMPGCDGASACEQVLSSKWSTIAGTVPISGLAMGAYLALLIAVFYSGPTIEAPIRHVSWTVMVVLASAIAGMAIWFTSVQKWIIGEFCPYCITAHISGMVICAIVIWQAPKQRLSLPLHLVRLILAGLIVAGILVTSQVVFTPRSVYRNGTSGSDLPEISYQTAPMVGSPKAPYVVKMLFDYQCPHCQKLHFMLNDAVHRYGGKLAFALCPSPLNTACNPYIPQDVAAFKNSCELAKTGLSVWVANREAYPAFDNWMFSFEAGDQWRSRSLEAARAKAVALVGKAAFDAASSSPWIDRYLQTCIQLYGQTAQNGKGGVPKLIFGAHWVIPEPVNADDLVKILQESLGVPAK